MAYPVVGLESGRPGGPGDCRPNSWLAGNIHASDAAGVSASKGAVSVVPFAIGEHRGGQEAMTEVKQLKPEAAWTLRVPVKPPGFQKWAMSYIRYYE